MTHFRLALLIISFSLVPITAFAEHEADHRYNVKGFVLDENNAPIAGTTVTIRLGNIVRGSQKTDSRGYYNVRLHLHDTDLGKQLRITTAAGEVTTRVRLTPGDRRTARVHHANIVGGKLIEEPRAGNWIPWWGYAGGGFMILVVLMFTPDVKRWVKRRRRRKAVKG